MFNKLMATVSWALRGFPLSQEQQADTYRQTCEIMSLKAEHEAAREQVVCAPIPAKRLPVKSTARLPAPRHMDARQLLADTRLAKTKERILLVALMTGGKYDELRIRRLFNRHQQPVKHYHSIQSRVRTILARSGVYLQEERYGPRNRQKRVFLTLRQIAFLNGEG